MNVRILARICPCFSNKDALENVILYYTLYYNYVCVLVLMLLYLSTWGNIQKKNTVWNYVCTVCNSKSWKIANFTKIRIWRLMYTFYWIIHLTKFLQETFLDLFFLMATIGLQHRPHEA